MDKPDITGIAPFFIVRDVRAALAFYRDRFGRVSSVPDPDALAAAFASRHVEFVLPLQTNEEDGLRGFEVKVVDGGPVDSLDDLAPRRAVPIIRSMVTLPGNRRRRGCEAPDAEGSRCRQRDQGAGGRGQRPELEFAQQRSWGHHGGGEEQREGEARRGRQRDDDQLAPSQMGVETQARRHPERHRREDADWATDQCRCQHRPCTGGFTRQDHAPVDEAIEQQYDLHGLPEYLFEAARRRWRRLHEQIQAARTMRQEWHDRHQRQRR